MMRRALRVQPERHLQEEAHESLGRVHVRRAWRDSALDGLEFGEQIETRSSLQDARSGEPDASLLAVPSGSLPGSTQGLRLNCVLSKNMFAMRGPDEVIRSTTR